MKTQTSKLLFKSILILNLAIPMSSFAEEKECIPVFEYIPLVAPTWAKGKKVDYKNQGYYQRISPDGNFIVRSVSGAGLGYVSLLEIKDSKDGLVATPYKTDLSNEAFALLSTFRFVVDIDGKHYKIKDILEQQEDAKSFFKAGATGVYAASTELAGGNDSNFTIRSIAWPNSGAADESRGTGHLTMTESKIQKTNQKYKNVAEKSYHLCENLKSTEGKIFTTPMISISGEEFAARPIDPEDKKSSMRIYKILDEGKCEKIADLGIESEKAIFGTAQPGKPAPLIWIDNSGLHYWDREIDKSFYLNNPDKPFQSTGFPSMTKDGRIMAAGKWDECKPKYPNSNEQICEEVNGYIRIDPNQSPDVLKYRETKPDAQFKGCITKAEVEKVEADQDLVYGLNSKKDSQSGSTVK